MKKFSEFQIKRKSLFVGSLANVMPLVELS